LDSVCIVCEAGTALALVCFDHFIGVIGQALFTFAATQQDGSMRAAV
jgi:hypothetical protein